MIKYFCDACGQETDKLIDLNVPQHLLPDFQSRVDITKSFVKKHYVACCRSCYTQAAIAAIEIIEKIRQRNSLSEP